ncbi:MAG: neutral zinc metallopeptidase, partial [Pseudomonas sp.]
MQWKKGRRSDNVEDVRDQSTGGGGGMRIGGGKGLSLMAVVVIVGIGLLTGQDPLQILGQLSGQLTEQSSPQVTQQAGHAPPANDQQADFVRAILGDTEDTWRQVFQQSGRTYKDPTLVLFRGQVSSACGFATAASGPFYC